MKNFKKILSVLLTVITVFSATSIIAFAEDEIINFPDANLKAALLKIEDLDYNNDSEISVSEAYNQYDLDISNCNISNLSGIEYFSDVSYFIAENNNISDITPLSSLKKLSTIRLSGNKITDTSVFANFTKAENIFIDYNNITDLTPFLELKELQYLSVTNNNLQTGALNSVNNDVLNTAKKIKETAQKNSEYGNVWGLYDQKLTFDESLLPKNAPTHKVLFSVVPNIDAKPEVANGYAPVKYSMSQQEINTVKAYADLFEKAIEKLSGYRFNIDLDFYVAKSTLTKVYAPAADYGLYDYDVFAPDVPELEPKVNSYDTTITVCPLNESLHDVAGIAGFGWINNKNNYYNRGVVFIPWDTYANDQFVTEQNALDNCYDVLLDTLVHEFCHTFEQYAPILNYNKINELHTAIGDWLPSGDNAGSLAHYLKGGTFSNNLTGVPDIVINNPPLSYTPKPAKLTGLKSTKQTSSSASISWNRPEHATGYLVQKYSSSSKKWVTVTTTTSNKLTVSKLSSARSYKIKVTPYAKTSKKAVYGTSATITVNTKPSAPKISKVNRSSTKLTVTVKKVSGAKGYELQISKYKNFKKVYKKSSSSSKTLSLSKLKKGTKYYIRVRSYYKVSNKKVYSSYTVYKTKK